MGSGEVGDGARPVEAERGGFIGGGGLLAGATSAAAGPGPLPRPRQPHAAEHPQPAGERKVCSMDWT